MAEAPDLGDLQYLSVHCGRGRFDGSRPWRAYFFAFFQPASYDDLSDPLGGL